MYILQAQCLDSNIFLLLWQIMQKVTERFFFFISEKKVQLLISNKVWFEFDDSVIKDLWW